MAQLVTIFGGSGFIGRYIAQRMAKAGWRVRVAVRSPAEAGFVRPYGVVGQVEPVFCNIRNDASVAQALEGADAAINCVGTFDAGGKNNFEAVQAEAPGRIARLCVAAGISRMVHISAIGADPEGASLYAQSKAAGEAAVLAHLPGAVILRPSVVFGPEDQFFNRFAALSRLGPVLPLVGAETKFQPVYVDNVAEAAAMAAMGQVNAGVYELGGPEVLSFRQLMELMLRIIRRRKLILNIPFAVAPAMAAGMKVASTLSLGIVKEQITADQVKSLRSDSVVSGDLPGLADLGIKATRMEAVLPDYLWRFRPSGQYEALKESARNLRA